MMYILKMYEMYYSAVVKIFQIWKHSTIKQISVKYLIFEAIWHTYCFRIQACPIQ